MLLYLSVCAIACCLLPFLGNNRFAYKQGLFTIKTKKALVLEYGRSYQAMLQAKHDDKKRMLAIDNCFALAETLEGVYNVVPKCHNNIISAYFDFMLGE